MSETKHTPGPWQYSADFSEYDSIHTDFSLDAGDVEIIGGCGCCGSPTISSEADARLIAAAPELLEALYIVDACGEPKPVELYDGEAEGWEWVHPDGREWYEIGIWEDGPPMHPAARAAIAKAKGEQP